MQTRVRAARVAIWATATLVSASAAYGATASALVSARVLGPAGEETGSGAVTISRLPGESAPLEFSGPGRAASSLARFRIGGGANAAFAVALQETAVVRGERGELAITGLRATGVRQRSLDAGGAGVVSVGADVRVPPGVAPGRYEGSYLVTIAYD
jgi:hypothetical protein